MTRRARHWRLAVGATATASAGMVWWSMGPWGPGLSPDAIAYAAIAESIRDRNGIGYWLEPSTSSWPPAFPALLAAVSAVSGLSTIDSGRVVNCIVQAGIVLVAAEMARRLLHGPIARATAVAVAAVGQPVVFVAVRVWSEPLFVLLLLAALFVLSTVGTRRTHRSERRAARLAGLGALLSAAFATRYAGLALVPTAVVVLALWPRSRQGARRAADAALIGAVAGAGAGAMVLWNRSRTGHAFGPRWQPDDPPWLHAADGLVALGGWWLPTGTPRGVALLGGAIIVGVVGWATAAALRSPPASRARAEGQGEGEGEGEGQGQGQGEGEGATASPAPKAGIGLVPVLGVFVGCYLAYMVYARTTSGFDRLSSRLLLPALLPSVLVVLAVVERWTATAARRSPIARLAPAIPAILLTPTLLAGIDELRTHHDAGTEYTGAAVRTFLATPAVSGLPADCTLVTNDPWLLWLSGREAQLTPEENREVTIPLSMELSQLPPLVRQTPVCLVWFETGSAAFYRPEELAAVVEVQRVSGDAFTTLYRLAPRPGP